MSIKTWKEEFYQNYIPETDEDAIEKSLMRWIGLRRENLLAHRLKFQEAINGSYCGLCEKFARRNLYSDNPCLNCPLYLKDNESCDDGWSKYQTALHTRYPEVLITALAKLLDKEIAE